MSMRSRTRREELNEFFEENEFDERRQSLLEEGGRIPVLPLRDMVVFPRMVLPLLIGREQSINSVNEARDRDGLVMLITQKDSNVQTPASSDLYRVGTMAEFAQIIHLPDGMMKVLIDGIQRAKIKRYYNNGYYIQAQVEPFQERITDDLELEALERRVKKQFSDYIKLNPRIPDELSISVNGIASPEHLADLISSYSFFNLKEKQQLLETETLAERLQKITTLLAKEIEILNIEHRIETVVQDQILQHQKEYYLQEQLKAINKELGQTGDIVAADPTEVEELSAAIKEAEMPEDVEEKAFKELDRFKKTSTMSPESGVIRNYLEWLIDMPWDVRTDDNLDVAKAKENLDNDHYGLKKVKERILEYLAVLKLVKNLKGPILCFVGPPGVGKTSLGRSIANTLNRKFVRVSLGGVRDEAEIRGHRRTYIGSMPGRIIQSIRKAKTKNPVFLLDEVDKMSMDFRGDPASALLEVLDPEQNSTFNDHFLDVDFDLSEVMFITTANDLYKIPSPLRDRMEIIRLPGYLDYEKLEIAKQFLIPKQLKNHGLSSETLNFTDIGIVKIINWYTKEAGVRNMEREIAKICRKVAKQIALKGKDITVEINSETLPEYLGVPKFLDKEVTKFNKIGTANGLAWTEHGGDILLIEVSILKGSGKIMLTGQLGDVMKESAKAAISYIRSRLDAWDIDENFYKEKDVHIHVPEGAIPKDGPSAGITIASALLSALTDTPTKYDVAMTGEITLRGDVLGIGGLNEKAVAAHRAGIKTIIVPKKNEKNMKELPDFIKKELDIRLVKNMDEVIKIVLAEKEIEN